MCSEKAHIMNQFEGRNLLLKVKYSHGLQRSEH